MGESPSPQPSPVEGEGDGVPPGMGSRLHGNDGWHGESPSPHLPLRERGTAWRRGWVPVCTGTTVGMGSHPHPPYRVRGRLFDRLRAGSALCRRGRGGRRAAGDGFPFARERRLAWGVTLTPALSRQGRGGRRAAGDGFPFARERRVCVGSHPHPSPLPSRERGTACRRGWVPVCTGTTGVCGESPSPQPSPVEGEGAGTLTHPPRLLPSRERGFRTQPRPLGSRPRLRGGMPKRE